MCFKVTPRRPAGHALIRRHFERSAAGAKSRNLYYFFTQILGHTPVLFSLTLPSTVDNVIDGPTPAGFCKPAQGASSLQAAHQRPRRLARPRTPPFHGDNTGSNPVGDAKNSEGLKGFDKDFRMWKSL